MFQLHMFEKLPSISEKEWNTNSGVAKFQVECFMCSSNHAACWYGHDHTTFSLIQLVKELLLLVNSYIVCTSSYSYIN